MELGLNNFSITINDESLSIEDRIIFEEWCNFNINDIGVYTLEGANRSGKSVLIKTIMGIHPTKIHSNNSKNIIVRRSNLTIRTVRDAYRNGMSAVFQDDELIPTMSIKEQIVLRHKKRITLINLLLYLYDTLLKFLLHKIPTYILPRETDELIKELYDRIKPNQALAYPDKEILDNALLLFERYNIDKKYLNSYPHELSEGTKAIIKIIIATLTKNIKILFLDEALNGIAEEKLLKQKIIGFLKAWAQEKQITLVIVSHNLEEIYRWQPKARYLIVNKKISILGRSDYDALHVGLNSQSDFFICYNSLDAAREYINELNAPVHVIYDSNIENNELFKYFKTVINKFRVDFTKLRINEKVKNVDEYLKNIKNLSNRLNDNAGTLIILGGGVLLNIGLFIAGTLFRGTVHTILIPTTLMAVADVVIGSKASLNIENKKHYLGLYKNPNAIIQDYRFLETLTLLQKKIGLVECMKHGLIQDKQLFEDCRDKLLSNDDLDVKNLFQIGLRTQELKSKTLINDNLEEKYGRILFFGHLHAHNLERYFEYEIEHGIAVLIGLFIDLSLNQLSEKEQILKIINMEPLKTVIVTFLKKLTNFDLLEQLYKTDAKSFYKNGTNFNILKLKTIGQYTNFDCEITYNSVKWSQIEEVYKYLQKISY